MCLEELLHLPDKSIDSHIGAIYGDSINYERAKRIFERLEDKGFASTNVVLGIVAIVSL
jgi:nicotinamide phosphoribosyltransferase